MINAKRIEEMKRLSTEATEGAWKVGEVETLIRTHDGVKIVGEAWRITDGAGAKDAQFIAESRQFVPDIITAYEAQAEEIAKLQKALEVSGAYAYLGWAPHSYYEIQNVLGVDDSYFEANYESLVPAEFYEDEGDGDDD